MKIDSHITAGIRSFDEASPSVALFVRKNEQDVRDYRAMEAELNELRYYFERNVERKAAQLMKRLALLEYCNATLCDRLAAARLEISVLTQLYACNQPSAEPDDRAGTLYSLSDWASNLMGTRVQDEPVCRMIG